MKREVPWNIVGPVIGALVLVVGYFFVKANSTPVVPASEIKAPAPPGGFPSGPKAGEGAPPASSE